MYNLTVATAHTFYVGSGQWLVHNQSGLSERQIQKLIQDLRAGKDITVKTVEQARQIIGAIEGARPLPQQFGMEDSIFKYPTYRGDLIGTTQSLFDDGLMHKSGNLIHDTTPHYNNPSCHLKDAG